MTPDINALVLMPEVRARALLRGHRLRLSVLAPVGAWVGCGTLRVLRVRPHDDESIELTVGYESYESLGTTRGAA